MKFICASVSSKIWHPNWQMPSVIIEKFECGTADIVEHSSTFLLNQEIVNATHYFLLLRDKLHRKLLSVDVFLF